MKSKLSVSVELYKLEIRHLTLLYEYSTVHFEYLWSADFGRSSDSAGVCEFLFEWKNLYIVQIAILEKSLTLRG